MDGLGLEKLLDDPEAQAAEVLVQERSEELLLELLVDFEPLGVVLDEVAGLADGGEEDLEVGLPQRLEALGVHVLGEDLGQAEGVPDEGRPGELVGEGVGAVDHWPELDDAGVEDIVPNLRAHVEQDLEVAPTEAFLVEDELGQLDETDPEDVVGDVGAEDVGDVVEDGLHVEVLVDVGRGGGLLEELAVVNEVVVDVLDDQVHLARLAE